jgi:hypothetical protein
MKTSTTLFVCAVLTMATLLFSTAQSTARQRDAWEYHVVTDDSVGGLNKLGADGWEVASAVAAQPGQVRVILKRRK